MELENSRTRETGILEDIQNVTDAALARLRTDDLLNELLDRVREIINVDTAAVLLLDPSGQRLIAVAARGLEEEVRQGVQIPIGKGFAGRIAADRKPVILDQIDNTNVLNPILLEKGITSMLGVPLLVEGTAIGVLHVGSLHERSFDSQETLLLQMVGDRIALAVHARQLEEHRTASRALIRSLLPAGLPAIDGVETAVRYAPGDGDVGGDWYDVFSLPTGDVALVVGDVAGKGLGAAVVMARTRSMLRAYALVANEPDEILSHLDRALLTFEPDKFLTVFVGIVNLGSGRLRYSSAGHLMPVVASPHDENFSLSGEADFPMGLVESGGRRSFEVELPNDSTIYLFTDGLVERRGRSLDDGLEKLRRSALSGSPERGCVSILGSMVGGAVLKDDFALLGVHLTGPVEH